MPKVDKFLYGADRRFKFTFEVEIDSAIGDGTGIAVRCSTPAAQPRLDTDYVQTVEYVGFCRPRKNSDDGRIIRVFVLEALEGEDTSTPLAVVI